MATVAASIGSRRRSSRCILRTSFSFSGVTKRDDGARLAGPAGAAGAVDVVLVGGRRVELQHAGHAVDVDAAGGDVGGDEHVHVAAAEGAERPLALALAAVAVDGLGPHAGLVQLLRQALGAVPGAAEHDGRPRPLDDGRGDLRCGRRGTRSRSGG